jgi:hypothetical protein
MIITHKIAGMQLIWHLSLIMNAWLGGAVYPENRYRDGLKSLIFTTCTFHNVCIGMWYVARSEVRHLHVLTRVCDVYCSVFLIKREQKIKDIEREKKDDSSETAGPERKRVCYPLCCLCSFSWLVLIHFRVCFCSQEAGTNLNSKQSYAPLTKSRGFEGGEPLTAEPHRYLTLAEITAGIEPPNRQDRMVYTLFV